MSACAVLRRLTWAETSSFSGVFDKLDFMDPKVGDVLGVTDYTDT